jgi:hypothetical protein
MRGRKNYNSRGERSHMWIKGVTEESRMDVWYRPHMWTVLSCNLYIDRRNGKRRENWCNWTLSYHFHLNRMPLLFRVVGLGETSSVTWRFEKATSKG